MAAFRTFPQVVSLTLPCIPSAGGSNPSGTKKFPYTFLDLFLILHLALPDNKNIPFHIFQFIDVFLVTCFIPF